ncbi:MAG: hypothetical protein QM658_03425 [Gordonia sp. (in: high G+C Gram-positive bacteria)]
MAGGRKLPPATDRTDFVPQPYRTLFNDRVGDNGDESQLTEAEVDALFEATAPIGRALNALAQAELAVAAVDELDPETEARLDEMLRKVIGEA